MKYYTVVFAVPDNEADLFRDEVLELLIEEPTTHVVNGYRSNPIQGAHVFGPYNNRNEAVLNPQGRLRIRKGEL